MDRRGFCALALGLALVSPVLAQGGPGGPGRGGRGGFRFGFGPGGGGLAGLLRMPEVQAELKVDDAQKALLEGVMRPQFGPGGFRGGQPGERPNFEEIRKQMEARRLEQEKKIAEVLDKNQMARLKQLDLQRQGIRAIGRPDVQTALKLSADQKSKVQAALQAERTGVQALFQPSGDGGRPDFQTIGPKMQELRASTDAKLNAVLTPQQKTQFTQMQGAKFNFPAPQFGRGGFGRRGGGQGGGNN